MSDKEQMIEIETIDLLAKVTEMANNGYRLVQVGCTKLDDLEINYSFDKDYQFVNYRITIKDDTEVPSISGIYWGAFVYENEIHDLFGVNVSNININFNGNFYKTAIKTPFNTGKSVVGASVIEQGVNESRED
ncbi:MAG: NADH dehydrogenase [Candidatus Margulisbacteria bacterium GWF2_38_17]|nr:MAG: NADH dehydrogenase [Candidatus Margulisbacteria bacterium GWF2_38_17]